MNEMKTGIFVPLYYLTSLFYAINGITECIFEYCPAQTILCEKRISTLFHNN